MGNNKKKKRTGNKKSGVLNVNVLARRVPVNDPRLFQRIDKPGKRDYFVVIGLDISGSTAGGKIRLIKEAGQAMAEVLHRLGIPFACYAHTGVGTHDGNLDLVICQIKSPEQPWNDAARARLRGLVVGRANLDGHTLEFYRKILDQQHATDRILLYFSDGAMPAENYHEELQVLQREVETCKKRGYTQLGVGVGCDDPIRYGFDTVRIDRIGELGKVVEHLGTRLEKR